MTHGQINAALKLQKEFLERLIESSKEVSSAGDKFIEAYHQNKEQITNIQDIPLNKCER